MTKQAWIIIAVICVLSLGGLIWISRGNKLDVSNVDEWKIQSASELNGQIADHTKGKTDSKVIIVEYGDIQCPGCGSAAPVLDQVMEKYGDKIGFVFRNFPLYNIHPNAFAAAAAVEAAGLQGKYWEMHKLLYDEQETWSNMSASSRTDYFAAAAARIGIDQSKLRTALTGADIKQKIDFDYALGKKANVTSTPAVFLNGKNVSDKYYKDDQLVSSDTSGAIAVWNNAEAFGKLIIEPALKEAGISLDEE